MKKTILFTAFAVICSISAAVPTAGRAWSYFSINFTLTKSLSLNVMPGIRYEFSRRNDTADVKEFFMNEFFIGPMYKMNFGKGIILLPFFYYYMGYPVEASGAYTLSHNLEFSPTYIKRLGMLTAQMRLIFNNCIYSNFYAEEEDRSDYSMLLRWRIMLQYAVAPKFVLEIGEEPFWGIIGPSEATPVTGPGFAEEGFDMNRINAGFTYVLNKMLALNVNYIYETSYKLIDGKKELSAVSHYIFLTFKVNL